MCKRNLQSAYLKAQNFACRVNKTEANPSILLEADRCRLLTLEEEEPALFFRNYKLHDCKIYRASSNCGRYVRVSCRNVPDPSQLEFQLCFLGTAQGEKNPIWLRVAIIFCQAAPSPVEFPRYTLPPNLFAIITNIAHNRWIRKIVDLEILPASDVSGKILDIESRGMHIPRAHIPRS